MISNIHIQGYYTTLNAEDKKKFEELKETKNYKFSSPCFLPILKTEPIAFMPTYDGTCDFRTLRNYINVFFDIQHVSLLEMTNTLEYLDSDIKARNTLSFNLRRGRRDWRVPKRLFVLRSS